MHEIVVHLERKETKDYPIDSNSFSAAVTTAEKNNPGFVATSVECEGESHDVLARCESCKRVLFDASDYSVDEDGIAICSDCGRD